MGRTEKHTGIWSLGTLGAASSSCILSERINPQMSKEQWVLHSKGIPPLLDFVLPLAGAEEKVENTHAAITPVGVANSARTVTHRRGLCEAAARRRKASRNTGCPSCLPRGYHLGRRRPSRSHAGESMSDVAESLISTRPLLRLAMSASIARAHGTRQPAVEKTLETE